MRPDLQSNKYVTFWLLGLLGLLGLWLAISLLRPRRANRTDYLPYR